MNVEARDYQELWASLRVRAAELAMTREVMDARAGLPSGYSGTLLAPTQIKKMGLASLGPILQALRLKLLVTDDGPPPALRNLASKRRARPERAQASARLASTSPVRGRPNGERGSVT